MTLYCAYDHVCSLITNILNNEINAKDARKTLKDAYSLTLDKLDYTKIVKIFDHFLRRVFMINKIPTIRINDTPTPLGIDTIRVRTFLFHKF